MLMKETVLHSDPASAPIEREAAHAALEAALQDGAGPEAPVVLAILDLDLFGEHNARQGREAPDAALRELPAALAAAAGPEASVFRYGGDAFAAVWRGVEKEQAFLAVERFRAAGLAMAHALPGLTLSGGIAAAPEDGARAPELLNKAFEALYRAKVSGRDKLCLAREEKMVTKTSHYTQGQLLGLRRLAEREGIKDAELLREALNDLLRKYNA